MPQPEGDLLVGVFAGWRRGQARHQFAEVDLQGVGEAGDDEDARMNFAAFDLADVGPVDAGAAAEALQAPLRCPGLPGGAQALAECYGEVGSGRAGHAPMTIDLRGIEPETITTR